MRIFLTQSNTDKHLHSILAYHVSMSVWVLEKKQLVDHPGGGLPQGNTHWHLSVLPWALCSQNMQAVVLSSVLYILC